MGRKEKLGSSTDAMVMESGKGEEKEKQGEKERDSTATCNKFFKVFFPEQSAEQLRIPSSFKEYLQEEPNRPVSLRGPSGNTWQVLLTSESSGWTFTKGWKEFAHDHSLVPGYFLVFTYDGSSQFSVAVFCTSGIEDKSAFNIQPRNEGVVNLEQDKGVVDVDVASVKEVSAPPVEEGNGTNNKRVRQRNDEIESGIKPKRHSSIQKKPEERKTETTTADTSKTAPAVAINSNKGEDSSYNNARIKSKDVPRMGKFVSKKFKQPVVTSQRRPITEEEKNHAFERAKEFKSKYPFTVQVMLGSYVYLGLFLNIPCEFVRESLPQASTKMKLWDPQGKSWEVSYVFYNGAAAFSSGWGNFAIGNNLEKFDVCVFELFKENNIKVHIYRVVTEITPLLRSSSM